MRLLEGAALASGTSEAAPVQAERAPAPRVPSPRVPAARSTILGPDFKGLDPGFCR